MSQTFLEDIPEFLEIQRNSFLRILDTGLIEALEKINPISTNSGSKYGLLFYPKDYVLILPENTITEAFLQGKTYGCKIYVPAIVYEAEKSTSKLKNKFVPIQRDVPSLTKNSNSNHKNKKYVKKNISSFRKTHEASEAFPKKLTPIKLANSLEITSTFCSNKAMERAYSADGENLARAKYATLDKVEPLLLPQTPKALARTKSREAHALSPGLVKGVKARASLSQSKSQTLSSVECLAKARPSSTLNLLMPKVSNRFISYLTQKSTVLNLDFLQDKTVKPLELLECAPIIEHTDGAKDVQTFSDNFASKSKQSRGTSTSSAISSVEPELFENNINFDLRKAKNRWCVVPWSKKPTYAQKVFFRQAKDTTKKNSSVNANSVKAKGFLKKKKTILIKHSLTENSRKDTSSNINPIFFQDPLMLPKPIVNVIGQHHIQFFKPSLHFLLQTLSNRFDTQPLTLQTVQKSLKKYWSIQKDLSKKDIDKKKFLSLKALRPLDSIREVQGLGKAIALAIAKHGLSEAKVSKGQSNPNAVATATKVRSELSLSLNPQASVRTLGAQGISSGFAPNLSLGLLESSKKLLECNLWWQWTKYKTAKGLNLKPDKFSPKSQRGRITFVKTLEDLRYTGSAKLAEERSSFDTENINSDMFVPQQLSKKEWVCVGMLPLMTPRGHFIINGSHRIVVSQMSRAPGLYYQTGEKVQATVVPSKGAWLRLSLKVNENGDIKIWVRITPQRKMPYKVFIETYKYLENLKNPLLRSKALQSKFLNLTYKTINSKIKHFDKHYAVGVISSQVNRTLLSFSSYTLGNLGRKRINERLGINENKGYLTSKDLYFIKKNLIKGLYENFTGLEDDIDHLKNRRVRTCGELLQTEIEIGLVRLKKAITKQLDEYFNPNLYTTLKTRNSDTLNNNYTIKKQNHLDKKRGFEKAKPLDSARASGLVMQSTASSDLGQSPLPKQSQSLAKHATLAKGLAKHATLNTQQGGFALVQSKWPMPSLSEVLLLPKAKSSPDQGQKSWPQLAKPSRGPESMPRLKPNLNSYFINTVDCENPNFYLRCIETDYNFTGVKNYLSLQKYLFKRKLSRVLELKKVFLGELGQKKFELRKKSLLVSKNQNQVQWPQRVGIDLALNKAKNQELSILKNPSRILGQNLYTNYNFSEGLGLRSRELFRNTDYTKAGAMPVISKPYYDLEPVVRTLLKNHKLMRHGSKALVFAGQIHPRLSTKSNLSESGPSFGLGFATSLAPKPKPSYAPGLGQGNLWPMGKVAPTLSTAKGVRGGKAKPKLSTLEAKLAPFALPPYIKAFVQTSGVLNKEGFFNSWVFPKKTNHKRLDPKKSKSRPSEVFGFGFGARLVANAKAQPKPDKSYKNVPIKLVGNKKEQATLSDTLQSNSKEENLIGKSLSYKKYDEGLLFKSGKKKNDFKSGNFERSQNFFPIASPSKLVGTKAFAGALREFFGSNPLSQYMDQTNPLAEITHKRRLSSLGPGGVDRASAGIAIRGIHPSHYGRICPIETPEGKNAGLVNSMTMWTRVNKDGFLETPYLKVKGGSIMSHNNHLVSQWHFVPTKKEGHYIRNTNYVSQEGLEVLDIGNGVAELSAVSGQSPNLVGGASATLAKGLAFSGANATLAKGLAKHATLNTQQVGLARPLPRTLLHQSQGLNDYQTLASSFVPESQASQTLEFQGKKIVASDLNFSESSFLPDILLPSRDGSERSFGRYKRDAIDFCGVSPLQNISVATSLIPFLEHDDATRALMGSNMQRQAVPLLKPKGPLVRTGLEGKVVGESGHALQATVGGIISTATRSFISIDIFTKEKKLYGSLYSQGLHNTSFASRALTQTVNTQTVYTKISKSKGLSCFKNFQKPYYAKSSKEVNFLAYLHSYKGLEATLATLMQSKPTSKSPSLEPNEINSLEYLNESRYSLGSCYSKGPLIANFARGFNPMGSLLGTQIWRKNSQINRQRKIQNLQQYTRSNQATICVQRPAVSEGHWVQKGDLIGDCSASQKGVLSLGQNIVVAYLPMEGFNFEDAIVVSDRLVHEELYTSIHIQRVEFDMDAVIKKQIPPKIKLKKQKSAYKTIQQDWITQKNPHLLNSEKKSLNSLGIIKIGSWVGPGDVLVSKVFPVERKIAPSRHLLLAVFQEKKTKTLDTEDTSLRVPKGIHGRVINVKIVGNGITSSIQNPKDQSLKKSSVVFSKSCSFAKNNGGFLTNKEKEWKPPVQFAPVRTRTLVKASRASSTPQSLFIQDRGLYKTFRKKPQTKEAPLTLTTKSFIFDGGKLWPKAVGSITKQNLKNKVGTNKLDFLDGLATLPLSDYRPLIEHKFNPTLKTDFDELALSRASATALAFGAPKILAFGASKALAVGASKDVASVPKASVHSQAFSLTAKARTREQSANTLTLGPLNHKTWAKVWVQARTAFLTVNYRQALDVWPGSWIFGSPHQGLGQCKSSINPFGQVQEKTQYEKSWTFTKKAVSSKKETLSEKLNSPFAPKTRHSQDPPFVTSSTEAFGNETTNAPSITLEGTRASSEVLNPVGSYSTSFSVALAPLKTRPLAKVAPPQSTGPDFRRWGFAAKASESQGGAQENQLLHKNFVRHRNSPQEYKIVQIRVYIAERKKLQVGDKMSGRHGNKGIVSTILPREDMPYLPDGTSVDMVLNPLGIPSRMNVGQVFECLLGLAASVCGETIGHTPFDEMYGPEASRSLVYLFLYIARVRARRDWLFQPNFPGKTILFDGRTGTPFEQWVTVGRAYMLKLIHMVDEKIHARSIGPRSLVTQQPVKGRARGGGQRLGEMELWALEGFGAAYTLQEILTLKSDDIKGRENVEKSIIYASTASAHIPETFRMMLFELRSLCLNVELN